MVAGCSLLMFSLGAAAADSDTISGPVAPGLAAPIRDIPILTATDAASNSTDHFQVTVAFLADDSLVAEDAASLQFFREYEGRLSEKAWNALRGVADNLKDK